MREQALEAVREALDRLYHAESRLILAILIRLLGDIDTAEDALQDAFAAAARQWPEQGIPANPRSRLISTGRFKAIDTLRRRSRFDSRLPALAAELRAAEDPTNQLLEAVPEDQLRLIFTCWHPALPADAHPALRRALDLARQESERRFLQKRLRELG